MKILSNVSNWVPINSSFEEGGISGEALASNNSNDCAGYLTRIESKVANISKEITMLNRTLSLQSQEMSRKFNKIQKENSRKTNFKLRTIIHEHSQDLANITIEFTQKQLAYEGTVQRLREKLDSLTAELYHEKLDNIQWHLTLGNVDHALRKVAYLLRRFPQYVDTTVETVIVHPGLWTCDMRHFSKILEFIETLPSSGVKIFAYGHLLESMTPFLVTAMDARILSKIVAKSEHQNVGHVEKHHNALLVETSFQWSPVVDQQEGSSCRFKTHKNNHFIASGLSDNRDYRS